MNREVDNTVIDPNELEDLIPAGKSIAITLRNMHMVKAEQSLYDQHCEIACDPFCAEPGVVVIGCFVSTKPTVYLHSYICEKHAAEILAISDDEMPHHLMQVR